MINGGFEAGGHPPTGWSVTPRNPATTYENATPGSSCAPADGSAASGGAHCFSALVGPSGLTQDHALQLSQSVPTCAGQNYTLDFDFRFDGDAGNYCNLDQMFDAHYIDTGVSSLNPNAPPGSWYSIHSSYKAKGATTTIDFFMDCRSAAAHVQIDNVVLRETNGPVLG